MSWHIVRHEELASTQDAAIAAARAGHPGPLAIIAQRQTAGRGRGGRGWVAPDGNLNFSAMLRPGAGALRPGAWSLLAGVAVHAACAAMLPEAGGLRLKWPNDVLLDGAKLAGVLIDSSVTAGGGVEWVVIGVGVNVAAAPAVAGRETACLAGAGASASAEEVAASVMAALDLWRAAPFDAVRAAWLARAHPVGTRLRVHSGADMIEGAFLGLTEDGRLKLQGGGAVASGDVEVLGD